MKIYPVKGRLVRDPVTGREVTDPEGTDVNEHDAFWIRRLADGDVSKEPKAVAIAEQPTDGGEQ